MRIKKLFYLTSILYLVGCSTGPVARSDRNSQYKIVNLGSKFDRFWTSAKSKSFQDQLLIWNAEVERPHQAFYDDMVWQKADNPKWEERKNLRLEEFFEKYNTIAAKMMSEFQQFDSTLKKHIEKFKDFFPDARFNLPIYAAPTASFNGKAGDSGDQIGKTVLAFGIDMMVDRKDNPDVLYSHELFHIYNTEAIGMNEQVFMNEGHLTLPLWLEGLATYVSEKMNPSASIDDILMDKDLPKVSNKELVWLAQQFLKEANEKAFDPNKPEFYKKWFAIDPQFRVRSDLPQRCGYLLGLIVVRQLAKTHSLEEMVHWKVSKIHDQVKFALVTLGGT